MRTVQNPLGPVDTGPFPLEERGQGLKRGGIWIVILGLALIIGVGTCHGMFLRIKEVLALSETSFTMPSGTAFNATGYDDGAGTVEVSATEIKLKKDSSWWNTDYNFKRQLTVKNIGSSAIGANTPISLTFDLSTLGLGTTKLQGSLNDLRVVYTVGSTHTELSRTVNVNTGSTNVASITFQTQASIGITNTSTAYYLYYGNVGATTPTGNGYNIGSTTATFVAPFNGTTNALLASGSTAATTATGAIRYSGEKGAMSFDRTSGDQVYLGTGSSLHITGDITLEAWVNMPPGGGGMLFGGNGCWDWHYVYLTMSGVKYAAYNGNYWTATKSYTFTPGSWYHIAIVGDATQQRAYFFINGQSQGFANKTDWPTHASADIRYIGANCGSGMGGYDRFLGLIDEARISNTIRYTGSFTPQGAPFIPDANTAAIYHFDENGDDPRQIGKAIDASGNGNHGTITGAKYVSGLVGVDQSSTDTGYMPFQDFGSHQGVFIEEATTNLINNPSFEHATYNIGWSLPYFNLGTGTTTFTAAVAKRNSAGPFAAGPMVQGNLDAGGTGDVLSYSTGAQIGSAFFQNFDKNQGSIVFWITPEWNGNDGRKHVIYDAQSSNINILYKDTDSKLYWDQGWSRLGSVDVSGWVAGSTYLVTARWDQKIRLMELTPIV